MPKKQHFILPVQLSFRGKWSFPAIAVPGAFSTLLFTGILSILLFSCHPKERADLVLLHGRVYTVDSAFSKAQAFAIKNGKIIAVGTDQEIYRRYEPRRMIDAMGKAVYPGFIDAHAHFLGYGQSLFAVGLFGCASFEEVVARVKQFALAHPGLPWITGRGWDQNKFPGKTYPDNTVLNDLFPGTPVVLERVDGHAVIANAKALELAGVQPGQQLTGGEIETRGGRLTGILIDNAQRLVSAKMPPPSEADYEQRLVAAQKNCFAQGLTTVTDCGLDRVDIGMIDYGWQPLGTDFPVEDISPFKTFLAAVFRVDAKGFPPGGFQPENALSREETIRGMTIRAARADCLEKEVGSIEVGKKADFIILDRDLMTVPPSEVLLTKVLNTYSGGVSVFQGK